MDNRFDHIEDSVRNAFDGFEMPVSDMDWTAIESKLTPPTPPRRGIFAWFPLKKRHLLLGAGLLFLGSGIWYFGNQTDTLAKEVATSQSQTKQNILPGNGTEERHTATADQNGAARSDGSSAEANAPNGNQTTFTGPENHHPNTAGTSHPESKANPGPVNAVEPKPNKVEHTSNGDNHKPVSPANPQTPTPLEPGNNPLPVVTELPGAGKVVVKDAPETEWIHSPLQVLVQPRNIRSFPISGDFGLPKSANTPPLHLRGMFKGWEFFGNLQANADRSKATADKPAGIWEGVNFSNYRNQFTNLRFDAGLGYRFRSNWYLGGGAALETQARDNGKPDTIRIKVPVSFLPYLNAKGDTLYLFARKWKDSMVIISHANAATWLEIPLQVRRDFDLGKGWTLNAGLSFNPGILAGASGKMVNPYSTLQDASYWKFYEGNVNTSDNTVKASAYMNHFRFGNGLQFGFQKQSGMFNWGLQAQARYYYTPVWKQATPLHQNTFNYGLNIRIGVKF